MEAVRKNGGRTVEPGPKALLKQLVEAMNDGKPLNVRNAWDAVRRPRGPKGPKVVAFETYVWCYVCVDGHAESLNVHSVYIFYFSMDFEM